MARGPWKCAFVSTAYALFLFISPASFFIFPSRKVNHKQGQWITKLLTKITLMKNKHTANVSLLLSVPSLIRDITWLFWREFIATWLFWIQSGFCPSDHIQPRVLLIRSNTVWVLSIRSDSIRSDPGFVNSQFYACFPITVHPWE